MLKVRCVLCIEAAFEKLISIDNSNSDEDYERVLASVPTIQSSLIARNREEETKNLINEMVSHLSMTHPQEIQLLAILGAQFNGFNVMNRFVTKNPDSEFEQEKELVRDKLCEELMKYAPDDEDEEEEELTPEEEEAAIVEIAEAMELVEPQEPIQNEAAREYQEGLTKK